MLTPTLFEFATIREHNPLSGHTRTAIMGGQFEVRQELTEAELMAARIGQGVARLRPDWNGLLAQLPRLGHVRAVTQNHAARMETPGTYSTTRSTRMRRPQHPIQLDAALPFWRSAFIEVERTHSGLAINRRIHFYGGDGSSVHTLHLASSSSVAVFEEILEAFVHPDQPAEPLVDEMPFARSAVSASDGHALSLSRTAIVEIFYYVARNEIPVTVSVMNAGCTQTHCGLFQRVRNAHGVLQVTGCGAEVCFREASIAWGRLITGSEEVKLFDARGREVAWIAPSRRAGPHKACRWREILLQWAHPVGSMTSGGHKMSDLALLSDAGRAEERRT